MAGEYKIRNCLGSRDAWRWVRKNKWKELGNKPFDKSLYSRIVDMVNTMLMEKLIEGHRIVLPCYMGSLSLVSVPTRLYYEEGRYRNTYGTDWKKTLQFWEEDSEARRKRVRIKKISDRKIIIRYSKKDSRYNNRRFYLFRANRSLVRQLGRALEEGRVNAEQLI